MRIQTWLLLALAACGLWLTGCETGSTTPPSFDDETPVGATPRVTSVQVNPAVSQVRVAYEPYDGWIGIRGWYQDAGSTEQHLLSFDHSAFTGAVAGSGTHTFTVTDYAGSPLKPAPEPDFYFTLIISNQQTPTVGSGYQVMSQTWKYANGTLTRVTE